MDSGPGFILTEVEALVDGRESPSRCLVLPIVIVRTVLHCSAVREGDELCSRGNKGSDRSHSQLCDLRKKGFATLNLLCLLVTVTHSTYHRECLCLVPYVFSK